MRMPSRRSITVGTIAAALTCVFIAVAVSAPVKGQKAPNIKMSTLDGKSVSLYDLMKNPKGQGRVVIMDFWATWCPPCRQEVPHLQKLHDTYADKGLAVVGVSVDRGGAGDVKPFVKENKVTYTILLDSQNQAAPVYGVRGIPATFIIDKKGVIRASYVGFSPEIAADMEKVVKSLLK